MNNTVYVGGGNGTFYALNATTGAPIWQSPNLGTDSRCSYPDGITSSATVAGEKCMSGVAMATSTRSIRARARWTGSTLVGSPTKGYYNWASPLVLTSLGYVYIGVASDCDHPLVNGGLDQVSLTTHLLVHFFSDLNASEQTECALNNTNPNGCGGSIWGSPSYDAATNTVWADTGNGYNLSVPEYGDSLMEWNATTLALINHWTIPNAAQETDGDFGATPTLVNPPGGTPMVFATDKNGWSYAFNRANIGAGPIWQTRISSSRDTVAPDAYGGGQIYIAGHATMVGGTRYNGSIRAFNPSVNKSLWADGLPGVVLGAPVYANGLVVVGGGNVLEVLNSSTGKMLYNYTAPGGLNASFLAAPSISHGIIYVEDMNGSVLAFGLPNPPQAYDVTFTATGLPPGMAWNVTFAGTTESSDSSAIAFQEVNGSWDYSVPAPVGYTVSPNGGVVHVKGSSKTVDLTFTSTATYTVTFSESGLPATTEWWVNVTGGPSVASTGSTLSFSEGNGTYPYSVASDDKEYAPTSPTGSFDVTGGPARETVTFDLETFPVSFSEAGLPPGTNWSVTLNGVLGNSTTSLIAFTEPNGTLPYTITDIAGWHETTLPYSGTVTVSGPTAPPTLEFAPMTYGVSFTESGLPAGTPWWVNLTSGPTFNSTTPFLTFAEVNATYDYTVGTADKEVPVRRRVVRGRRGSRVGDGDLHPGGLHGDVRRDRASRVDGMVGDFERGRAGLGLPHDRLHRSERDPGVCDRRHLGRAPNHLALHRLPDRERRPCNRADPGLHTGDVCRDLYRERAAWRHDLVSQPHQRSVQPDDRDHRRLPRTERDVLLHGGDHGQGVPVGGRILHGPERGGEGVPRLRSRDVQRDVQRDGTPDGDELVDHLGRDGARVDVQHHRFHRAEQHVLVYGGCLDRGHRVPR